MRKFEDDPDYTMGMKSHWCEAIKNWVGGPVEDCVYHRKLNKNRRLVQGANTLSQKKGKEKK